MHSPTQPLPDSHSLSSPPGAPDASGDTSSVGSYFKGEASPSVYPTLPYTPIHSHPWGLAIHSSPSHLRPPTGALLFSRHFSREEDHSRLPFNLFTCTSYSWKQNCPFKRCCVSYATKAPFPALLICPLLHHQPTSPRPRDPQ